VRPVQAFPRAAQVPYLWEGQMTEAGIQKEALRCLAPFRDTIMLNCMYSYYEADILRITAAGYFHEYEIKVSKSDFKNDFVAKAEKHRKLKAKTWVKGPCCFWYMCPANLIQPEEVPEYAGLIWINPHFVEKKKAPRLHKEKFSDKRIAHILRKGYGRYWRSVYDAWNKAS